MKRLDLIFSERELSAVLKALEAADVPGYTVMKHVTGRGPERVVSEDTEFTGLGANAHVIIFCEEGIVKKLKSSVDPILNYYGGIVYVSDVEKL